MAACLTVWQAAPSAAGWREDLGTFRIGVLAEPGGGNAIAGLGGLTDAFSRALGIRVTFYVGDGYSALIDALVAGQIQSAGLSAVAYAAASQRCHCVEPLVAPVGEDGSTGIRSVLIARSGRLTDIAALAGSKVALSPPDSVTGFQLPLATLVGDGGRYTGSEPFFVHAASTAEAETMLAKGSVDAMFGWAPVGDPEIAGGTLARLEAAGVPRQSLAVVWRSEPLRYGPQVVRSTLDPEAKTLLADFLTGLKLQRPDLYGQVERLQMGGFMPAEASDYRPAEAIVTMLGQPPAADN